MRMSEMNPMTVLKQQVQACQIKVEEELRRLEIYPPSAYEEELHAANLSLIEALESLTLAEVSGKPSEAR